jgi:hypothetical protein
VSAHDLNDETTLMGEKLSPEQVEPYKVLNIVGLVGSIDNDMSGTDATIGSPVLMADIKASHPQCRPMTSMTKPR